MTETQEELLDVVDDYGQPTGSMVSRKDAHKNGVPHRTVHVWVIREGHAGFEALLQKRGWQKELYPGLYDISAAGHSLAGEPPIESAIRELGEELGIAANPDNLVFIGTFWVCFEGSVNGELYSDKEFANTFVYTGPFDACSLKLQSSEVDEVRWFDLREVRGELSEAISPRRLCVSMDALRLLMEYHERVAT